MSQSAKGIVIHTIAHSDRAMIARIFTEKEGLKTFLVRRNSGSKSGTNLFQPLSELGFITGTDGNRSMQTLSSPVLAHPRGHLITQPVKSMVVLFMSELLHRTLEEDYSNESLYKFISQSAELLDQEDAVRNFPIWFTLALCRVYGFDPTSDRPENVSNVLCDPRYQSFLYAGYSDVRTIPMDAASKRKLLSDSVHYLMSHLGRTSKIHSLEIMLEVLRG